MLSALVTVEDWDPGNGLSPKQQVVTMVQVEDSARLTVNWGGNSWAE